MKVVIIGGVAGGMLDLYSKLYNVTKAEANQQIREALNLGQYRDDYQRPARQERDLEPPAPVNSERASDREAMEIGRAHV